MARERWAVFWFNRKTKETGQGSGASFSEAKAWCDLMNAKYPMIDHWVSNASYSYDRATSDRVYPAMGFPQQ